MSNGRGKKHCELSGLTISMAALFLATSEVVAQKATVYSSIAFETNVTEAAPATAMLGDKITLAGSNRSVTEFLVRIGMSTGGTVEAQFRLDDGVGGEPGTIIWSDSQTVPIADNYDLTFPVPSVNVPDTFFWVATSPDTPFSLHYFGPPVVGASDPVVWVHNGTDWSSFPFQTNAFYARVFAEPYVPPVPAVSEWGMASVVLLLLTGLTIKFGALRFRKAA